MGWIWKLWCLLFLWLPLIVHGSISCTSDEFCQEFYQSNNTVCLADSGVCSNPLRHGCLRGRLGDDAVKEIFAGRDEWVPRVCSADDDLKEQTPQGDFVCIQSLFSLNDELRIHQAQWDTGLLLAWIYEVLLMEVVKTPASVGIQTNTTAQTSFYAKIPTMEFSSELYPYEALEQAFQLGGRSCHDTDLPCVHVLPDVNPGQSTEPKYQDLVQRSLVEPVDGNGMLGRTGLHVPSRTLAEYPSLGVWQGLTGEDQRELLAQVFLRPTTWLDYCELISNTTCSDPDDFADRYPETEEEEGLYFEPDYFRGFFRETEKNNCLDNPTTCTGHVVAPPCEWSARLDAQLFWNDIVGLESDGSLGPTNSYTGTEMAQIWRAANATNSHVIMLWNQPDTLDFEFFQTDYEFQLVLFPLPTAECLNSKPSTEQKCSELLEDRVAGLESAACGDDIYGLQRLIVSSIQEQANQQEFVDRSPAYEFLKNIQVTTSDTRRIIRQWKERLEPDGMDARYAVCDWIIENRERITEYLPPGHPRAIEYRSNYSAVGLILARIFGAMVAAVAMVSFFLCWKHRATRAMVFAQPAFMQLIMLGFCMISIGAMLYALTPTTLSCTASSWLLAFGYTVELVPVIVKTSAFNRLIRSSKKQKRVNISRRMMMAKVLVILAIVTSYLTAWSILDPANASDVQTIRPSDINIVESDTRCASQSDVWGLITFAWEAILLILAAFLAFQSRDVMSQINESKNLAIMVYSHFLFVCLRGVTGVLYATDSLPGHIIAALFSYNYALDAFCAMAIYVFPKLIEASKNPEDYRATMISKRAASNRQSSNNESTVDRDDSEEDAVLRVLCCTGNMGNAEPTSDSMEEWIPPGGQCHRIASLDQTKTLPEGTFDIIAIGMQEATWKDENKIKNIRGEVISEEEILNALEEKNTAHLREMIQDLLGDSYSQMVDEQRGQMRLQIWASDRVADSITDIRITGANTGIGNVLANKGGIVTTLTYEKTRISFLSAHLAAHEGQSYFKARCDNIRSILREAKTFAPSKKIDVATSSHHMFLMGDLNFRTQFAEEMTHEEGVQKALRMVEAKDYSGLEKFDELQMALKDQELLVGFETLPCTFPPTFKVFRTEGYSYTTKRTPSYTDRILFKSFEGLSNNLVPLGYEACPNFVTSDHKPIRGAFEIFPNKLDPRVNVKGEYSLTFEEMRCSNLPAGDADGLSDPYLMFLWDASNLESETKSLVDQIRKLSIGHSWPRTKYISKTLDPDWGDETTSLLLKDCHVGSDQMLFIAAIDFDAVSKDECLGVLALSLKKLITMDEEQREKVVYIDQPFLWEGQLAGEAHLTVRIRKI